MLSEMNYEGRELDFLAVDLITNIERVGTEHLTWAPPAVPALYDPNNKFREKGDTNEKTQILQEIPPQTDSPRFTDDGRIPRTDEGSRSVGDGQTPRSSGRGPEETSALAELSNSTK